MPLEGPHSVFFAKSVQLREVVYMNLHSTALIPMVLLLWSYRSLYPAEEAYQAKLHLHCQNI